MTRPAPTQADLIRQARKIAAKGDDAQAGPPVESRPTPDEGFVPVENPKLAPSGALDHAGEKPSRERSRTRY